MRDLVVVAQYSPLNSPLHSLVRHQHGHAPEQDLVPRPSERIEDTRLHDASEWSQAIVRDAVVNDAFLWRGACFEGESGLVWPTITVIIWLS